MPDWLLDEANKMPAWVLVIGIGINAAIAFVAIKSVLPGRQKLAAYLVHETESNEINVPELVYRTTHTTHIWSIGIKNLGPHDVVDLKVCDYSPHSRWWSAYSYILYPTHDRTAQFADWEASYIPADGHARIYLNFDQMALNKRKGFLEDDDSQLNALRIEYKTLSGRRKRVWLTVSFSTLNKYLHLLSA